MAADIPEKIGFGKVAKLSNNYSVESGQYLAERYMVMRDAYTFQNNSLSVNQKVFKQINNTNIDKNVEHFIVNRKYEYALYKEDGKTADAVIQMPRKYQKYIATIANYLIINQDINSELGNRPVYEKIEILERKIKEKGLDYVIPSRRSQLHYYLIKKVLHDESKYPAKELEKSTKRNEKEKLLKGYYQNYFEDEFKRLVDGLNNENLVLAAEMEDNLLKRGFKKDPFLDRDDYSYIFEYEMEFANVRAELDIKEKKLIMSAERYNPTYGEKEDEYEKLIETIVQKFKETYEKEPFISSSDEWGGSDDVSFVFSYEFDWDIKEAEKFVKTLKRIDIYCRDNAVC